MIGVQVGTSLLTGVQVGTSLLIGVQVGTSLLIGVHVGNSLLIGVQVGISLLIGVQVGTSTIVSWVPKMSSAWNKRLSVYSLEPLNDSRERPVLAKAAKAMVNVIRISIAEFSASNASEKNSDAPVAFPAFPKVDIQGETFQCRYLPTDNAGS